MTDPESARVIALVNQKGGCAKTTTAVNLAACLAVNGHRTLLIDLDPQSHATLSFGVELETDEPSIFWAMGQENNDRALLAEIAMPVERGLSLVPSAPLPIHEEESLMGRRDRLLRLRELVAQIQKYDFVVIDCPPALGILTCNAFMASQAVLLPVETSFYAMHGVGRALEAIADLEKRYGHAVRHMAVATLFDRRTALARDILEELRRYYRHWPRYAPRASDAFRGSRRSPPRPCAGVLPRHGCPHSRYCAWPTHPRMSRASGAPAVGTARARATRSSGWS
ncbi:MAG: ParA family protein, partial [Armatimonadetes bacterium]|nr:ParA family protein [Armatimonadota bacterium]